MGKCNPIEQRHPTRHFLKTMLVTPIGHRPANLPVHETETSQRLMARQPANRQGAEPQRKIKIASRQGCAVVCVDLNKDWRRRKLFKRCRILMKRLYFLKCGAENAALLVSMRM